MKREAKAEVKVEVEKACSKKLFRILICADLFVSVWIWVVLFRDLKFEFV